MIFLFEIPVMFFLILILGLLGINIITIITWVATISLVISIIWFLFADNKILNIIVIALNILLLVF